MMEFSTALTASIAGLLIAGSAYFLAYFRMTKVVETLKYQLNEELNKNILLSSKAENFHHLEAKHFELQHHYTEAQKRIAELQTSQELERRNFEEKMEILKNSEEKLKETFQNLSSEALHKNNHTFMEVAKLTFEKMQQGAQQDLDARQKSISDFVKPMRESLDKIDTKLQDVEKTRVGAYEGLKTQIDHLLNAHKELKSETVNLVHALKTPRVRGRWGEIQLRRVVEMSGMVAYCDFQEQVHGVSEEEARLRPDMIVKLPGGQNIVIDAKAPMGAYLESMEAETEAHKTKKLQDHARHIRHHIKQLSARSYWSQFDPSPEFVILFLPGETFFSAALQEDPSLIELGAENKVILTTPTSLIALLRAVSYGWRQEKLADNAREISKLGQTLYDRLADLTNHLNKVGRHLGQTVNAFNQTIGSFEQRVMVSARRFESLGLTTEKKKIDPLTPVETKERQVITQESTE